ncbi:nicotinamide phosphoribosyltransferase [Thamnocephalis sphaerospora]|uniref:Nicotinamide phosphoribosyltransferase n=1 Tax=Thamnocephalis sphaerospora TaxID=78915 RepID=A0A4P9XHG6_9FUNG|nr:nicotinamide phosphoribosyltransferase [Thamnocephalis sphaerospora]|eukprot:RKP04650.1 nicotinamide phosphoribosyltransferase [Thamnocephalis sphaerospora]
MSGPLGIPLALLTDSYKTCHPFLYPDAERMVAYGEFRCAFDQDPKDHRIVFYGIRHIIETIVARQWTEEDVERADAFFHTHNAGHTAFPFPKDLFLKFVKENQGHFPVRIEALPEGTICYPHTPVYQISTSGEYAQLATYLETILTMVWYPSTVATLSRRARDLIEKAYKATVDEKDYGSLESRLHDFGFRACTSVEQSVIGGAAHLLNFHGTDTLSAAYHVQFHLNEGRPIGTSIPATEHSVMMSYPTEREAILRVVEKFGTGAFACVLDSYDYARALSEVLPSIATEKLSKGGFMVMRPDSGDPVETVLMALRACEKVFGVDVNDKGYKVTRGCGVIQGDGVTYQTLGRILDAVREAGFAANNVAFGMGGGLLQRVNRDTMSFATKLSQITHKDGTTRAMMKTPKSDTDKISLPGEFYVLRDTDERIVVYPKQSDETTPEGNLLRVVYDHGPQGQWDTFDVARARVAREWARAPPLHHPVSDALKLKIASVLEAQAQLRA